MLGAETHKARLNVRQIRICELVQHRENLFSLAICQSARKLGSSRKGLVIVMMVVMWQMHAAATMIPLAHVIISVAAVIVLAIARSLIIIVVIAILVRLLIEVERENHLPKAVMNANYLVNLQLDLLAKLAGSGDVVPWSREVLDGHQDYIVKSTHDAIFTMLNYLSALSALINK